MYIGVCICIFYFLFAAILHHLPDLIEGQPGGLCHGGPGEQCFGSGLDPDLNRGVDPVPDPEGQK